MFAPSMISASPKVLPYRSPKIHLCSGWRGGTEAWTSPKLTVQPSQRQAQPEAGLPISRAVLLDALHKEQIQAWLQPKIALRSPQLVGVEALARWSHPQWGRLAPDVFLPWFRLHGLDEALLMHMLKEALSLQKYWRRQHIVLPVAVNLPTHLLNDAGLPDRLAGCVQMVGGKTRDITFELLEDSDTSSPCALFMGAARLRAMGFAVAQDDAGVGYSSIRRLSLAPFTEVKLDRRLVQGVAGDCARAELMHNWIWAAKQRNIWVTAEGVESPDDLAFLVRAGCDYAQGYLFARPVPAFELTMWIRQHWMT